MLSARPCKDVYEILKWVEGEKNKGDLKGFSTYAGWISKKTEMKAVFIYEYLFILIYTGYIKENVDHDKYSYEILKEFDYEDFDLGSYNQLAQKDYSGFKQGLEGFKDGYFYSIPDEIQASPIEIKEFIPESIRIGGLEIF